ncbi:MAG: GntR family transcriptional regulator [Devosia sp.]
MKSDTVYKLAFNRALELVSAAQPGDLVPSENVLSTRLSVSRTTVRKVLAALAERGIVRIDGSARSIVRPDSHDALFPAGETVSAAAQVERRFMEWMLRGDTKPDTLINELDLARQFGVGTTAIREFLNRFSRFGLIEKRPNAGWIFKGITAEFGLELYEVRELFEMRSAMAFAAMPIDAPIWRRLAALRQEHVDLLSTIETNFHDFSDLDNRFHRLINEAAQNRFVDDFYDIITFIFHYHYQWNKRDEKQRNAVAIAEHLAYIDALLTRDRSALVRALTLHLRSAKTTFMDALKPV